MPDAVDRRERALRRSDADSVERDERPVPRERARAAASSCKALGATPAITIANPPYTGGEAADWWRQAAQAAILIRQVYFTSPGPIGLSQARARAGQPCDAQGHARARRALRRDRDPGRARRARVAVPVGARPGRPAGAEADSRRGSSSSSSRLSPRSRSPPTRRSKASGRGAGRVSRSQETIRTSPPRRACISGRDDPKFCDAPTVAGVAFDQSLTEGQIALPPGTRCTLGTARIAKADVGRTAALTGDLGSAATALLERVVLRADEPVDPCDRARVGTCDRSRPVRRQRRALPRGARPRRASRSADARAIIADRLARDRVKERFRPKPATARQVSDFVSTYASTNVRLVSVDAPAPWLGRRPARIRGRDDRPRAGVLAPARRDAGRSTRSTAASRFVRSARLCRVYALAPARARDVARAVLGRFAKDDVYQHWLRARQTALLGDAVCARDDVPAAGDVDLTLVGDLPRGVTRIAT